jgi:hypothetical protein
MDMDDDLIVVRKIFHTNMFLCLFIVQLLFLFGIDQTKYKVRFSAISDWFERLYLDL